MVPKVLSTCRHSADVTTEKDGGDDPRATQNPFLVNPFAGLGEVMERQMRLARDMQTAYGFPGAASGMAVFKARLQKGGRVSIPDPEREALGLQEGDLVQVIVLPLSKRQP